MTRLSREQKRELKRAGRTPAGVTPIDVRVSAEGGATVGGMPVPPTATEPLQSAVLDYLHRLALATGHPVLATVHDERIGYAVPLQVYVDGSSQFAGEPVRVGEPRGMTTAPAAPAQAPAPMAAPVVEPPAPEPRRDKSTHVLRAVPESAAVTAPEPQPQPPAQPQLPAQPQPQHQPRSKPEPSTLRLQAAQPAAPEPVAPPEPKKEPRTMPLRAAKEPGQAAPKPSTFVLRAIPEPKEGPLAQPQTGTVSPPTGEFGAWQPDSAPEGARATARPAPTDPQPEHTPAPTPVSAPDPLPLTPPEESAADPYSVPEWRVADEDTDPKPAPVREFDAVAESVLDPGEADADGGAPSPFAESVLRINEAVKMGRIETAAEMAEQTVSQATVTLGPHHAETLKLRELTAYIAYLAGDALRSFHLSLDLARIRHQQQDPRAAYGNVQSAAAAWRAVRDPLQGLHLGRDLIGVWSELAADAGPAAEDVEQLEKARTRMGRLTERARSLDAGPYAQSPHAQGQ
ncbi:hypothetical protein SGFS_071130 [Streptomyces graminofaciens]|uniref:Tetratricopeptide repeat protein n=1 Tax=Streptomyces graminofaciens TaxID=68212 RepID=A0ABM7FFJ5_9ACTN|nr:hypothetical protein [Streptomyces graminofaciens]BBC35819.1 hypothetical protein SGFS_071130 [Streptomyces graminofaciens]